MFFYLAVAILYIAMLATNKCSNHLTNKATLDLFLSYKHCTFLLFFNWNSFIHFGLSYCEVLEFSVYKVGCIGYDYVMLSRYVKKEVKLIALYYFFLFTGRVLLGLTIQQRLDWSSWDPLQYWSGGLTSRHKLPSWSSIARVE